MKKIEYILKRYSILLRIILFVAWFLLAFQSGGPIKKFIFGQPNYYSARNIESGQGEDFKVWKFVNERLKLAKTKGSSYGPWEYFEDLKLIDEKRGFGKIPRPEFEVGQLQRLSWENVKKGYFEAEECEQAASDYRRWYKENIGEIFGAKDIQGINWEEFLSWVITLYGRTIFLVFFFYLARMADRKGILETILAEKKKFVLAVILWPVYFFKYPYNVVREIRVEAELRRLKGLFRKLSFREFGLVREVANSSYYKQWIAGYRQQNRGSFRRGLFLALMVTLFLHLLLPSNLRASEKRVRSPGLIVTVAESWIKASQSLIEDAPEDNQQVEQWVIPPGIEFFEPLLLIVIVKFLKNIWYSREPDSIDRVPRSSLFGVLNRNINQIKKGERNEHGQENNLAHCFSNWNNRSCIC